MTAAAHVLDDSFGSPDRALDRNERPFRLLPGGKAKALPRARTLRALAPLEALCLAWVAGLVHDQLHPFSEVMIDEGSVPVELPGECVSSAVYQLLARRGFVVASVVLVDGEPETLWSLTPAGETELLAQRAGGHLAAVLPIAAPEGAPVRYVDRDPEYTSEQYAEECWAIGGGR